MIAVDIMPRGAFHVGELGVGREGTLEHVPSDTLYSALVSAWVQLGEDGPFRPPPLRITSMFPRVGTLRLYPRPYVRIRVEAEQRDKLDKRLSRCRWCSERIFTQLVQGADVSCWAEESNFVHGVWFHPDDPPPSNDAGPFWKRSEPPVPHVTIDRRTNAPNLFHTGRTTYAPNCGLWFGVELLAPDALERLRRALDFLSYAGLGGLRSTGHGGFSFKIHEEEQRGNAPFTSNYVVTLARYLPASAEEVTATLQAPRAAFKLDRVGGWCQDNAGHPWRRKQIRLVQEGSVIGWPGQAGTVVDLKPDGVGRFGERPVLRYGLAFPLPVREEALL